MSFSPLSKNQSFDERNLSTSTPPADFKPLKKAFTMINTPTYLKPTPAHLKTSDVLHRQHFNAHHVPKGMLKKGLSLEGMNLTYTYPPSTLPPPPPSKDTPRCIVVVDCFSTGSMVAHKALEAGYQVIRVDSFDNPELAAMVASGMRTDYNAFFTYDGEDPTYTPEVALSLLIQKINKMSLNIVAVIAGAETGVSLADRLSESLSLLPQYPHVRTNGSGDTESRRNKYLMGEQVRDAGVRAVMQCRATTWSEIATFLTSWSPTPFNVIVKPMESAGSDDVTLCHSTEEVKAAFGNIMGKVNSLGCVNDGVLVQEYLQGTEYVVDTVSIDGQHKCVALWEYDRRATNGAGFVLHGQRVMTADEPRAVELIEYMFTVLDALNIKNGPGHGEVKWFNNTPCLVEVGSRCHGAEGMWVPICDECVGTNQVTATLDAYCETERFLDNEVYLPQPAKRLAYGAAKMLLSHVGGVFNAFNPKCIEEIKNMTSFRALELFMKEGKELKPTIDCFTWTGAVLMANKDEALLNKDYSRIEEMCTTSEIYEYTPFANGALENPKPAVVVVDPFSTGAVLAADAVKRGYPVICCYSAALSQMENLVNLVPKGLELHFAATIGQKKGMTDANKAAIYTAGEIMRVAAELNFDVVACMAGAETGVGLSDRISEKLGLRTNGGDGTEARRNKYLMCEKIRAHKNTRAVKQLLAFEYKGVGEWLREWNPVPFKVIVKPVESAGSDDVKLCLSEKEVEEHMAHILSKLNGLGNVNEGVLVQEFLEGAEYVVDTVSRDGVSKCMGIWKYHKEAVNGHTAPIVYYGQKTLVIQEEENGDELQRAVDYVKVCLEALGIKNGPAHAEVKMVKGEPCLVEVGARCHGAEGCWRDICRESHGWDQINGTLDAYLDEAAFAKIPLVPQLHVKYPRCVFMVNYTDGMLKEVNKSMLKEICEFSSYRGHEVFVKEGTMTYKTTDCFTFLANVLLCHESLEVIEQHYARIREMENTGFLVFE